MKLTIKAGATSNILHVFILDSASTTGAGKTGLLYSSAGLTAYYIRPGEAAATAITLVTITTLGTYASGGFKEIDAANLPGLYEFHPPDACMATGKSSCSIMLKGATGMAPLPLEMQLAANIESDAYGVLTDAAYGLAKLLRSTTPANTLGVDASGQVAANNAALSNLDAAITTRAPAATALSNATWTDGKAGYLDAAITSRPTAAEVKTAIEAAGSHLALILEDTGTTLPATLATLALEATLTAIKGTGWTTQTLVALVAYVDELETRLTAARAGYLDKLNVTGVLANIDNAASFKADVSTLALEATLTAIKGTGWTTETLKAISDAIAALNDLTAAEVWAAATRSLTDKAGFALSGAGVDAILDEITEGAVTLRQVLRLVAALAGGKSTGGGTDTLHFRDLADTKNRVTATVDASGNRLTVTLDLT